MAYNPNLPAGSATAANSAPVVIASDQVQDVLVTGASGQTALGNNLLLTSAGTASVDTMQYATGAPSYRSIYIQVVGTGTVSGALTFEGSNDNVNFVSQILCLESNQSFTATPAVGTGNSFYSAKIAFRYIRLRISTAITGGGSVQAIYRLSPLDYVPKYQPVTTGGTVIVTVSNLPTSNNSSAVTTAGTNATYVGSARSVYLVTISNPTATAVYVKLYTKGSAPTVGTDVPLVTIPVPAYSTFVENFGVTGLRFSSGLAWAATGGMDATDTSNAPAGVQVSLSHI